MDLSKLFMYSIASNKGSDAWRLEVRSTIDSMINKLQPLNAVTTINIIDTVADFKESYPDIYKDPDCRLLVNNRDSIDLFVFDFIRFVVTLIPDKATLTSVKFTTSSDINKSDCVPVIKDTRLNNMIQDELKAMLYALAHNVSIGIAKTIMNKE